MKKILLLIACVAVGMGSVDAQIAWGARVGVNYATISAEGDSYEGKPGLDVGVVAYKALKNNLYLHSGLLFSIDRFEESSSYEGYSVTAKETLSYLTIPVQIGYNFGNTGGVSFYGQAGPFVAFNVAANYKYSYGGESESGSLEGINALNYGLGASVGASFDRFKVEIGYKYGMANIIKDADDVKLSNIFLGVSYVF